MKAEFETIVKNLNKYSLKIREKIVSRLETVKSKYRVGVVFTYTLTQREGVFSLRWSVDQKAMDRLEKLDGA